MHLNGKSPLAAGFRNEFSSPARGEDMRSASGWHCARAGSSSGGSSDGSCDSSAGSSAARASQYDPQQHDSQQRQSQQRDSQQWHLPPLYVPSDGADGADAADANTRAAPKRKQRAEAESESEAEPSRQVLPRLEGTCEGVAEVPSGSSNGNVSQTRLDGERDESPPVTPPGTPERESNTMASSSSAPLMAGLMSEQPLPPPMVTHGGPGMMAVQGGSGMVGLVTHGGPGANTTPQLPAAEEVEVADIDLIVEY